MPLPAEFDRDSLRRMLQRESETESKLNSIPHRHELNSAKALFDMAIGDGRALSAREVGNADRHLVGEVVGGFEILELVGVGGMGSVFRARCRKTKRIVALKLLTRAREASPDAIGRFRQEAKAAGLLSHPNIVTAYGSGEDRGLYYLAMEYVDGSDLGSLVLQNGPVAVHNALRYIAQAARGLEHVHKQHIVHRDLKPGNLLLASNDTVKVSDLGVARVAESDVVDDSGTSHNLTVTAQLLGSFSYMPPEQAADPRSVDPRADIYALGCTLFHLLTGKPPYTGESWLQVVLAHHQQTIPRLRTEPTDLDEALNSLLASMLAKSRDDRYDSMQDVVLAIETILESQPDRGIAVRVLSVSPSVYTTPNTSTATSEIADTPKETLEPASRAHDRISAPKPKGKGIVLGVVVILGLLGVALVLWASFANSSPPRGNSDTIITPNRTRSVRPEKRPEAPLTLDSRWPTASEDDEYFLLENGWRIGRPVNLGPVVNSTAVDRSPFISSDGLTLLFGSLRNSKPGNDEIWMCKRPSLDAPFETPVRLGPAVNTGAIEFGPAMSSDGKALTWQTNNGGGAMDIWLATRFSTERPFTAPRRLGPCVNTPEKECQPHLSGDGLRLYFASEGLGGLGWADLWMSQRESTAHPFGEAVNLGSLVNSPQGEWGPSLTADECTIVFTSKRDGTLGHRDLWMATRQTASENFGVPINLGPRINTASDGEAAPAISADGGYLFYEAGPSRERWKIRYLDGPSSAAKRRHLTASSPRSLLLPRLCRLIGSAGHAVAVVVVSYGSQAASGVGGVLGGDAGLAELVAVEPDGSGDRVDRKITE